MDGQELQGGKKGSWIIAYQGEIKGGSDYLLKDWSRVVFHFSGRKIFMIKKDI